MTTADGYVCEMLDSIGTQQQFATFFDLLKEASKECVSQSSEGSRTSRITFSDGSSIIADGISFMFHRG